ncbi:hypothetical protein RRX38_07210 [Pseudomonas sp. DTU_2021_1001937_2_SI_NGA_ILE_001]|uniref:hypothetical protein n=1 Tax=Pseudomonas sp. DTU_2021_1001937_2_SI_NGA_ILE_001 TaxID=3077589 RepID=UPI0025FF2C53|nr:hypothetical protein [Pseudomonas sp. DTU_2021_1001937_2_SI_NGA_ILE_001]WNW10951.1 hypothetical protein RRX38_07210 [Pseudomonas sp. DTU_2021_1001937_2_SI_NGA_ILE_001]
MEDKPQPGDASSALRPEPTPHEAAERLAGIPSHWLGLPDISGSLKAPQVCHVAPQAITAQQANVGVTVEIPGSPQLRPEDVLVFCWGGHESSSTLHHVTGDHTVVRRLCLAYPLIETPEYGPLQLYYRIYRAGQLIGTSPTLNVCVLPPDA